VSGAGVIAFGPEASSGTAGRGELVVTAVSSWWRGAAAGCRAERLRGVEGARECPGNVEREREAAGYVMAAGADGAGPGGAGPRARWARMACTARGSCTVAMTRSRPPQRGQARTSMSNTAPERDELVGFLERERDRLLEKDVLAGGQAVPRHREVGSLRGR